MRRRAELVVVAAFALACAAGEPAPPGPIPAEHPAADVAPASSPATYADAEGFAQRRAAIVASLAGEDLQKWRTGYFAGGDPAKYLVGAVLAKLLQDPQDAMARRYMNDERAPTEHYHFAAVNWARFWPLHAQEILAEDTRSRFAERAARFRDYVQPSGTENHRVMSFTSGIVLGERLPRIGGMDQAQAKAAGKRMLRDYVRGLYAAGQGEWDSSTYLIFDLNGMLNVYDFSGDAECRLLAKAALDWYVAGYALKYTDGIYCAPHQRGWAGQAAESLTDQTGWLWWGSSAAIPAGKAAFRHALHAGTSSWWPNRVLTNIATRRLPQLPLEWRNTKPNYWFGLGQQPAPGSWHESVRVARGYTLGTLWNGFGGQAGRIQLVARTPAGPVSVTGGSPVGRGDADGAIQRRKYQDGNGAYDQSAQIGSTVVCLTELPPDEPTDHAFVSIPAGVAPTRVGDWWTMRLGDVHVGIRPLGPSAIGEAEIGEKERAKGATPPQILRLEGRRTGFVMHVDEGGDAAAFAAALASATVDLARWDADALVACATLDGRAVTVRRQAGERRPAVSVDGQGVSYDGWAVYGGEHVRCEGGVLTVHDGVDGYIVDMTGELPVYRAWRRP